MGGSMWLSSQYSISCESDFKVKTWLFGTSLTYGDYYNLAVVMVLVYPVGVPLLVGTMLYSMRDKLFEPFDANKIVVRDSDGDIVRTPHHRTSKYLGSLYVAYSSKYYWWEIVELFQGHVDRRDLV